MFWHGRVGANGLLIRGGGFFWQRKGKARGRRWIFVFYFLFIFKSKIIK